MSQDQRRDQHCHNLNSESEQLNQQLKKEELLPKNDVIKAPINNIGHWSTRENAKYYAFLKKFSNKFGERQQRRQWKVFKALSKFVKTRNANQCRSHHHKMTRNFTTIKQTLEFLSSREPQLQEKYHEFSIKLNLLEKTLFNDTVQSQADPNQKQQIINWASLKQIGANSSNLKGQIDQKNGLKTQNIITAASYEDQDNFRNLKTSNNLTFQPSFNPRSWMLHQPPVNYQGQYFVPQHHSCTSMNDIQSLRQQQYQRKVLECHNSFLKWITKTQQVVKISKSAYFNQSRTYY